MSNEYHENKIKGRKGKEQMLGWDYFKLDGQEGLH